MEAKDIHKTLLNIAERAYNEGKVHQRNWVTLKKGHIYDELPITFIDTKIYKEIMEAWNEKGKYI